MIRNVTCAIAQRQMSIAMVGELARVERLEMEGHVRRCLRCANMLADLRTTAVALDRAYAPARLASVAISPARARLAARAPLPAPVSVRVARITTRLNEVALAAAVTAFAFIGAGSVLPERNVISDEQTSEARPLTHVTGRLDDANFVRWIRLERYVPPDDLIDPTAEIRVTALPAGGGSGGGR